VIRLDANLPRKTRSRKTKNSNRAPGFVSISRSEVVDSTPQSPSLQAGICESLPQFAWLGPPPLIDGEDPAAYEGLRTRVSGAVKPKDFLEEIWVRDVVDLSWECLPMRRLKAKLITAAMSSGLDRLLEPLVGFGDASELASQWEARDRTAMKQVKKYLADVGATMETVTAWTLSKNIDTIERMDRMIMSAEARRNAALREVDRHRASLAQALRQVSDDVVEADFEEVPPQQPAQKDAA